MLRVHFNCIKKSLFVSTSLKTIYFTQLLVIFSKFLPSPRVAFGALKYFRYCHKSSHSPRNYGFGTNIGRLFLFILFFKSVSSHFRHYGYYSCLTPGFAFGLKVISEPLWIKAPQVLQNYVCVCV